jgi:hypothetical protein
MRDFLSQSYEKIGMLAMLLDLEFGNFRRQACRIAEVVVDATVSFWSVTESPKKMALKRIQAALVAELGDALPVLSIEFF